MATDLAIPGAINVIKTEAEKISKYKDLKIEILLMWYVKTKVISVIMGVTGTISKSIRQYLSNIAGKHEIRGIQNAAILGTAHKMTESTNVKVQNTLRGRNNITCSTNCKYRTAATLYTLETWFVSGIKL